MKREEFMKRGRFIPTQDKCWSPTTSRFLRRELARTAQRGPRPEEVKFFRENEPQGIALHKVSGAQDAA